MIRSIKVWPDPALRKLCESIEDFDDEFKALVQDLWDTMISLGGIGIAAPQIGEAKQVFLLKTSAFRDELGIKTGDAPDVWVFANPLIVEKSKEKTKQMEGCLSFPGIYLEIERPKDAFVMAQNIEGELFSVQTEGYLTNGILHEIDHLSGKTIADFVGILKKKSIKKKLEKR